MRHVPKLRFAALLVMAVVAGCAASIPPATNVARAEVEVVVYTTAWCPVCTRTRQWFGRRGIPYRERDVEEERAARYALRRLNPAATVPVIDVEGEILIGYDPDEIARALDRAVWRRREGTSTETPAQ